MTWMHIALLLGYLVVLLAIIAFFRGATRVSRDLEARREERERPEGAMRAPRRAA